MGEAELQQDNNLLMIHAVINIYGDAANDDLSFQIAKDIENFWNEAEGKVQVRENWFSRKTYDVRFSVIGKFDKVLTPQTVFENTDPRNNYFRIEEFAYGNISFVDGIGCNSGYLKLENLYKGSTTAAHEYGHTIGLDHPGDPDLRGKGIPGIMYPRGTLVDPQYQYEADKPAGAKGGTLHPMYRKVMQQDIDNLNLHRLVYHNNLAVLGEFTSIWHPDHAAAEKKEGQQ